MRMLTSYTHAVGSPAKTVERMQEHDKLVVKSRRMLQRLAGKTHTSADPLKLVLGRDFKTTHRQAN